MGFSDEQKKLFDACYAKAKSCNDESKLVKLVYTMLDILKKADESYEIVIPPKSMGIHPQNRSGKKMKDAKMQKKGVKIHRVGFARQLCGPDRAIGFEDHPTKKPCEQHTIIVTKSSKMFGSYKQGSVRGGSVGCSHLNQWLHAANSGAECPFPELCDVGKNTMSKYIIVADNDDLRAAMDVGLTWTMIKWSIEVDYPALPSILQRGLNVEHHVGEGELLMYID